MRRGSREFVCGRQLDFGYDISQKNTQGNAVKTFRISGTPFFEPSAMYNNNQTLLDVYDIRAKEKIKKLKFCRFVNDVLQKLENLAVGQKGKQIIGWGFPIERTHREIIVLSAVNSKLLFKVFKRVKSMSGIEVFVIFAM